MKYKPLPEKALKKYRAELYALHQRCIKSYLVEKGLKLKTRRKFGILYKGYVTEKNILKYWNIPINLFVQAIVKDTINEYFKVKSNGNHKNTRRKSVHRKK